MSGDALALTMLAAASTAAPLAAQPNEQIDEPRTGRMAVLDAAGSGVEGATVRVLRDSRGNMSPMAAVLVDAETDDRGIVQAVVPRLAGLLVVVDHPGHLPFVARYQGSPPPSTIRLDAGGVLAGEVVARETGAGVPEAEVCASWTDEAAPERFRRWRRCGLSDQAGRFEVAGRPPDGGSLADGVQVAVSADGFDELALPLQEAGSPVVLTLDLAEVPDAEVPDADAAGTASPGHVLVEVVGSGGEPVESFTMRVQTASGGRRSGTAIPVEQPSVPATASIPARYLETGMVAVTFEADDHLRSPMTGVRLLPGGELDLGVVFLESGATVSGRIFDAVGAEPAAGCLVELLAPGAGEIRAALLGVQPLAVSDEDGLYRLGGLTAGRYLLRKQCYGAPVTSTLVVPGSAEQLDMGETWLDAGQAVEVWVDGLAEGTVRVLDRFKEAAKPIAEAPLLAPRNAPPWSAARAGDAETPSAVAELLLAPGVYRVEALDAAGALHASQEDAVAADGPAETQALRLWASTRDIRGVLTLDGLPVNGGSVRFGPVLDPGRGAGTIMMTVQGGSAASTNRMFRPGGQSLQSKVEQDGSFVVEGAPGDLLWMTWTAANGSAASRLWPEGTLAQLDLGGTRVSGVLLDRNGRPVAGRVALIGDIGREVATANAAADGRFDLLPAPPGRYVLRGRAADGAGSASAAVELTAEAPPPQTLRMAQADAGGFELSLHRSGGEPVAGAWLHVVDAAGDAAGTGLSSERGRYARDGVPAGDVSVIWNDSTACVGGRKFTVEEGETTRLDWTLPTGRLLELRCPVSDCAGAAMTFVSVRTEAGVEIAGHLSGAAGGVRFSAGGALGLGCVTPGSYELSFWTAGRRWTAAADVGPADEASAGSAEQPVVVRGQE